jgi:glycosyltransferase involved in cell wall biosynthesis
MNVLHVVTNLDPMLGGSVEAARQIAAAMQRCGVTTEVLTLVSPRSDWLKMWPMPVYGLGKVLSHYRYTYRLVPWLRQNCCRYDAIVVHGIWRYPSFGVWRAMRRSTTPYFVFTHGMLDPWFQRAYRLKHLKKAVFWRLAEHRVLRDAKGVLFTSEEERRLATLSFQPYRCRERVVGLGTAAPPSNGVDQREDFLNYFPNLRGKRLVLFLGRIHRKKGCDLLIKAFGAIASRDNGLHLVIAGPDDDGLRPELERIAAACGVADSLTWTGHLNDATKWGAFRAAEVFVLPSHSENYGIAIAEAMACGVPVLITDKINIWREIDEDGAGLVANDDLNGTIDLLQRWCSLSPERREIFAGNARRCFQNRFELDRFAERFVSYLSSEMRA